MIRSIIVHSTSPPANNNKAHEGPDGWAEERKPESIDTGASDLVVGDTKRRVLRDCLFLLPGWGVLSGL